MSSREPVKQDVTHLRPFGWEQDSEERYKLSTLDYLPGRVYVSYAIFFKIEDDSEKPKVAELLIQGLERTLSQTRHLCGTIEKDPDGGHSFVKKRDSTVQLVTKWMDQTEHKGIYPTFSDLETANFVSKALGDISDYSVSPMTYGEKPETSLDAHPKVAAFQANFIRGGLVFMMHHHHAANDVMGWAGELHQLAENCAAIWNKTAFPPWDPTCLDVSLFTKEEYPADQQVDGPTPPQKHPDHRKSQWLLFHLPKSKVRLSLISHHSTTTQADHSPPPEGCRAQEAGISSRQFMLDLDLRRLPGLHLESPLPPPRQSLQARPLINTTLGRSSRHAKTLPQPARASPHPAQRSRRLPLAAVARAAAHRRRDHLGRAPEQARLVRPPDDRRHDAGEPGQDPRRSRARARQVCPLPAM